MSYYAGGAAGTLVVGIAFEGWGWMGSVLCIALIQVLALIIAALVWRQPVQGASNCC